MKNGIDAENISSAADKAIGVPRVGVGVVVLNHEDHVLIGKRKSPHGQGTCPILHITNSGTWSLPGVFCHLVLN
jgi:ADP-ribose pyrophosphatase YjhB (NUDIX family)